MKELKYRTVIDRLCVLKSTDVDTDRTGRFQGYVAFGDWTDCSDGPSVRFHGGTPFSSRLDNAPVMHFNIYGDCKLELAMWMNQYNCPNLYDDQFINQITSFVQTNLPILYLVYERYLDKEDAKNYFEGRIDYEILLSSIYRISETLYSGVISCENNAQLHKFCVGEQIYGKTEFNSNRELLCSRLEKQLHPVFEISWEGENCILRKYNGNRETVHIPENVDTIGENAFRGHTEIKKIIFPEKLETVESGAFSMCSGIEMMMLPSGIWEIGENAFADCTGLRTVCFEQCTLHEVYLANGAFRGCSILSEVYLPQFALPEGDPFPNCQALIIHCQAGTPGEAYVNEHHIPYVCTNKAEEEENE